MKPLALVVLSCSLVACSSFETRAPASYVLRSDASPVTPASVSETGLEHAGSTVNLATVDYLYADEPAPALPQDGDGNGRYGVLRLGGFSPRGDVSGFDTGFWGEIGVGERVSKMLSFEGTIGYYDIDGSGSSIYGVPAKVDARLTLPLWILEVFGGAGLGGLWAHTRSGGTEDDLAWFWNGFIGAGIGLDKLSLGLEYRYMQSGDLDAPGGGDFQLEGHIWSLYGSLSF